MNKKIRILIIIVIIVAAIVLGVIVKKENNLFNKKETKLESNDGVTVIPTMNDEIKADSSWCGTFQLVWNDMKNQIAKKDIVLTPQLDMVRNLNKEDFNETMISDDYYYKIYGLKSLELKNQIENGIKDKFNQTSDILGDFDWSDDALDDPNDADIKRYFFYTMLYRKFEFLEEFDKLDNGKFGSKYKDIKYFGIDKDTNNTKGDQIDVLYYNSKDDFAIIVNTKTNDEVILCKNPQGKTFNEIYDNMNSKAKKYEGDKSFKKIDEFKAPNLEINEEKEYTELEDKKFKTIEDYTAEIDKAIQTVKFKLDEKGGEVKSEAAIDVTIGPIAVDTKPKKEEPRYFYVDDTFAIFLREKGKDKPYFAGRIDDITKFQK